MAATHTQHPRRRAVEFGVFLTNQHPVGRDLVRGLDEQVTMLRAA